MMIPVDTVAPTVVTDLVALSQSPSQVTLTWTAPGDDANSGTASAFEIRYAAHPDRLTPATWEAATVVPNPPPPLAAGALQTVEVSDLTPDTRLHFALRTVDASGNWSGISNLSHATVRQQPPTTVTSWGTYGEGPGQFRFPSDAAVHPATGYLYVVDTGNDRIQIIHANGVVLHGWGSSGTAPGQFALPSGVAIDADGNVYVTDTTNHRIQKFTGGGDFQLSWGSHGKGPGEFDEPTGIAIGGNHTVYVADTGNHRIQAFGADGSFLREWGTFGSSPGEFAHPGDVAVDKDGRVFVTDTGNHRIQRFDPNGQPDLQCGALGAAEADFNQPAGLALRDDGRLYVAFRQRPHEKTRLRLQYRLGLGTLRANARCCPGRISPYLRGRVRWLPF